MAVHLLLTSSLYLSVEWEQHPEVTEMIQLQQQGLGSSAGRGRGAAEAMDEEEEEEEEEDSQNVPVKQNKFNLLMDLDDQ